MLAVVAVGRTFQLHESSTHIYDWKSAYRAVINDLPFDLETWACEFVPHTTPDSQIIFLRQCRLAEASRWILIPFAFLVISVTALAGWKVVKHIRKAREQRSEDKVEETSVN
jgi:hypothetical protein